MSGNDTTPLKNAKFNYYHSIFNKYDRDRDGFITVHELNDIIESREYEHDIPPHVVQKIHEMHDVDGNQKLDFDEFVAMINNPNLNYLFGHYFTRYVNWMVPRREDSSRTVTDGEYEDEYNCYPPAVGMIIISLVEIIFYCIDAARNRHDANGPAAALFIYDPNKRGEVWRFVTYMFVHIGVMHLIVNLLVQILLGIPLEMVHKWWRVLIVYFAGVLAGSLGTSIVDPAVKLAGASGGVYSLLAAHVATIIMNWKEMSFPLAQLAVYLIVAVTDVGTAIYNRYVLDLDMNIGYASHIAGALAGLLVGIYVLRNLNVHRHEQIICYVSMVVYALLMGTCIVWNLAWPTYFGTPPFAGRSHLPLNHNS
ncbi:rhomboid-related protein 2 [Aethina tumida]|uniref:rhomboid-related protein 2 n=1 Tax=Aethina tumida TaxID=116153 RepID=UPI002148FA9C|nr:rhomboid-related protein 2 [Aethina tumida]